MHNSFNAICEDLPRSSMILCKLWDLRWKLRRQLMRMASHTTWWHILTTGKWQCHESISIKLTHGNKSACQRTAAAEWKRGEKTESFTANFQTHYTIISLIHIVEFVLSCLRKASAQKWPTTLSTSWQNAVHGCMLCRGCAGVTKQKNTHSHAWRKWRRRGQCVLHWETAEWLHTKVAECGRCLYATLSTRHIYK